MKNKFFGFGEKFALTAALFGGDSFSDNEKTTDGDVAKAKKQIEEKLSINSLRDFILDTEVKLSLRNPEYFLYHENGVFDSHEYGLRSEQVTSLGTIFHDVGLDFYVVQQGETLSHIKEKLVPLYPYLQNQKKRMNGFNIADKDVVSGMMLPIPLEKERKISDQEFLKFAYKVIEEMEEDPEYGEFICALRQQYSDEKIAISLLAIAKQESGGKPIGQFELHRFEPKYKTFSYSIFHVLMTGPGETARKELGMTAGQTYHPENAIKLFFGFIIEKIFEPHSQRRENFDVVKKAKEKFIRLFELDEDFVSFYNGRAWKKMNPEYLEQIRGYYGEAQHYFGENGILVSALEVPRNTPVVF